MNINRNNYESFFLLYIDNELSVEEKSAVDQFVQVNPDLEEEFVMLQQTVLKAEELEFDGKESLFRSAGSVKGMEEKLLLHLDNELDSAEQMKLNDLIHADEDLKKEWELLQRTRLQKDELIAFPDKKLLYRKEAGRVIAFPWRRIAAAAMLIGVATWAGVNYLNNDQPVNNIDPVATTETTTPVEPQKEPAVNDQPPISPKIADEKQEAVAQVQPNATREVKVVTPTVKRSTKISVEAPREALALKTETRSNNLPKLSSENINKSPGNNTVIASVTPQTPGNNIRPGKNEVVPDETTTADVTNSYATSAAFNELGNKNEDHVFFLPEEKVKKTKLAGFFRKVKRVIDRTANVKEGNHIKVANLEFAIQ